MWTMLVLGGAIFFLFTYQFKNAMRNVTTVEDNLPDLENPDNNPFARGLTKIGNLETIMGPMSLKNWFLPIDSLPRNAKSCSLNMQKTSINYKQPESDELGPFEEQKEVAGSKDMFSDNTESTP